MIITSLLDLDLYKLTVGQVVFTYFRDIEAMYRMTVRNGDKIDFWKYVPFCKFDKEIQSLKTLSLKDEEAKYLDSLGLFSKEYIEFLKNEPMKNCFICWHCQDNDMHKFVPEVRGKWCEVMLYEIFCLSVSNELYSSEYLVYNHIAENAAINTALSKLDVKITDLLNFKKNHQGHRLDITEFGTRRRFSKKLQKKVISELNNHKLITGTSNVGYAKELNIPVKGTFGHEFIMGLQGVVRIQDCQKEGFQLWLDHYKGKLAIALNDTLGTRKFLKDFSKELAEAYAGLRHDSGDPIEWAMRMVEMYERYQINPRSKTLMFSDGLDIYKAEKIYEQIQRYTNTCFGIGTNLTNDSFIPVPQVVMKIIMCNGQPVAKTSNDLGKASCIDDEYLKYVKHIAKGKM